MEKAKVGPRTPAAISRAGWIGFAAALMVGVPIVLVAFQGMPPLAHLGRSLAHPQAVTDLLRRPFAGATATAALWVLAWAGWAWFMVCVAMECFAWRQGRAPRRVPGSRQLQAMAAICVSAMLTLGMPGRHGAPLRLRVPTSAANGDGSPVATLVISDEMSPFLLSAQEPPSTEAQVVTNTEAATWRSGFVSLANEPSPANEVWSSSVAYTVKPGDTLWSIAEHELGDPLLWPQIARANYDRSQADGGRLTDDHWIRPGWVFIIPTSSDRPAEPPPPEPTPSVLPPSSNVDPLRATASEVPTAFTHGENEPTLDPVRVDAPGEAMGLRAHASRPPDRRQASHQGKFPVVPIGYGILGAAVIAVVERMRRAQHRRRSTGLRIALPVDDVAELERGLRAGADRGAIDWVDMALRFLATLVRRTGQRPPTVSAVRVGEDAVDILVDDVLGGAPPPFKESEHGRCWTLERNRALLADLIEGHELTESTAPLPALVTLGRDERGVLLVNLETAGSVAVAGEECDSLLEAMAVEMATAPWAEQADIVLVGIGADSPALDRVSHVSTVQGVASKLRGRVRERRALLALADRDSNAHSRWVDSTEAWDLCVVVCGSRVAADDPDSVADLIELAGDGALGVVAVCAQPPQPSSGSGGGDGPTHGRARWRARAEGGRVTVEGTARRLPSLSGQPVPPHLASQVGRLLEIASQEGGVSPSEPPYDAISMSAPDVPTDANSPVDDPDSEGSLLGPDAGEVVEKASVAPAASVVVRVLGPIEVSGAARQFTRAWALELVVYLAVHKHGVSNEQWPTALWPDRVMAPASLHSTASAARRCLGSDPTGADLLPRARGRLALSDRVETDWDRFTRLARSERPADWKAAIALIRGRPFDGLRSPDWVVLEGIAATIEAAVVDLACRYATHCLDRLDPREAEWAARQALRVSPYDERLYRVLLRAADVAGNPAGVESVMAELVRLVAEDIEPFDAVHPETADLYRSLSRRSLSARRN
jgi:DNA-binding SARP family transcriptional activator